MKKNIKTILFIILLAMLCTYTFGQTSFTVKHLYVKFVNPLKNGDTLYINKQYATKITKLLGKFWINDYLMPLHKGASGKVLTMSATGDSATWATGGGAGDTIWQKTGDTVSLITPSYFDVTYKGFSLGNTQTLGIDSATFVGVSNVQNGLNVNGLLRLIQNGDTLINNVLMTISPDSISGTQIITNQELIALTSKDTADMSLILQIPQGIAILVGDTITNITHFTGTGFGITRDSITGIGKYTQTLDGMQFRIDTNFNSTKVLGFSINFKGAIDSTANWGCYYIDRPLWGVHNQVWLGRFNQNRQYGLKVGDELVQVGLAFTDSTANKFEINDLEMTWKTRNDTIGDKYSFMSINTSGYKPHLRVKDFATGSLNHFMNNGIHIDSNNITFKGLNKSLKFNSKVVLQGSATDTTKVDLFVNNATVDTLFWSALSPAVAGSIDTNYWSEDNGLLTPSDTIDGVNAKNGYYLNDRLFITDSVNFISFAQANQAFTTASAMAIDTLGTQIKIWNEGVNDSIFFDIYKNMLSVVNNKDTVFQIDSNHIVRAKKISVTGSLTVDTANINNLIVNETANLTGTFKSVLGKQMFISDSTVLGFAKMIGFVDDTTVFSTGTGSISGVFYWDLSPVFPVKEVVCGKTLLAGGAQIRSTGVFTTDSTAEVGILDNSANIKNMISVGYDGIFIQTDSSNGMMSFSHDTTNITSGTTNITSGTVNFKSKSINIGGITTVDTAVSIGNGDSIVFIKTGTNTLCGKVWCDSIDNAPYIRAIADFCFFTIGASDSTILNFNTANRVSANNEPNKEICIYGYYDIITTGHYFVIRNTSGYDRLYKIIFNQ